MDNFVHHLAFSLLPGHYAWPKKIDICRQKLLRSIPGPTDIVFYTTQVNYVDDLKLEATPAEG